jgi:hypothetical protein
MDQALGPGVTFVQGGHLEWASDTEGATDRQWSPVGLEPAEQVPTAHFRVDIQRNPSEPRSHDAPGRIAGGVMLVAVVVVWNPAAAGPYLILVLEILPQGPTPGCELGRPGWRRDARAEVRTGPLLLHVVEHSPQLDEVGPVPRPLTLQ